MKTPRKFRIIMTMIAATTISATLLIGGGVHIAAANTPTPQNAVVVLDASDQGAGDIQIFGSSSSDGAPTFASGTSLAEALSKLLAAGFKIQHSEASQQFFYYTLVK